MFPVAALYPNHEHGPAGAWWPTAPCPNTLLVCVPASAADSVSKLAVELAARTMPHTAVPTAATHSGYFPLWWHPDPTEQTLLIGVHDDPFAPGLAWCAGGPIGLLDLQTIVDQVRACAEREFTDWSAIVADTPAADPWWHFIDAHHADPQGYPLTRAEADFVAQPRIAAMVAHDTITEPARRFTADFYGPALDALGTDLATFADYLAGVLAFADALVTLDGQLLVPSWSPVVVEQSLTERHLYHQRARDYITGLPPTTLLIAIDTYR